MLSPGSREFRRLHGSISSDHGEQDHECDQRDGGTDQKRGGVAVCGSRLDLGCCEMSVTADGQGRRLVSGGIDGHRGQHGQPERPADLLGGVQQSRRKASILDAHSPDRGEGQGHEGESHSEPDAHYRAEDIGIGACRGAGSPQAAMWASTSCTAARRSTLTFQRCTLT